jgi:hypothetical protein
MGGTFFSLSSASDHHHHETFFCFFLLAQVCKLYLKGKKIKPTMGQKKLKTDLGFETLPQSQ